MPTIWNSQGIAHKNGWYIEGTILKGSPHVISKGESFFSNLWHVLQSYFTRPYQQFKVVLKNNDKEIETVTDNHGHFVMEGKGYLPENIVFQDSSGTEIPHKEVGLPQKFEQWTSKTLVISDIDDTILISQSAQFLAKLRWLLLSPVGRRKAVSENAKAYRKLSKKDVAFVYVSASETNLIHIISLFFIQQSLPIAPILLRPYQTWKQVINRKNRKDYKLDRIRNVINWFPEKGIVLFGDDSQHDIEVFHEICQENPQQIEGVFLRRTGMPEPFRIEEITNKIDEIKQPVYHYNQYEEIAEVIEKYN